jgi:hypothetical protein
MMHSLQRMEQAMDRFLGTGAQEERGDDIDQLLALSLKNDEPTAKEDRSANPEPPDLVCDAAYRKYIDERTRGDREILHTYNRLNAIWKSIYTSMEAFFVKAEASAATISRFQGPHQTDDLIQFNIKLTGSFFKATLNFTHVTKYNRPERYIGYNTNDMKLDDSETGLDPIRFTFSKALYKSDDYNRTPFNTEAELMDARFVAYDVLSQLQPVLLYNRTREVVRVFSEAAILTFLSGDLKESILKHYREVSYEAAVNQLRLLLLQCRPGFHPPMSLEHVRSSNLTQEQAAAGRP